MEGNFELSEKALPTFFLAITLSLKQNVSKNLWAVKENFEFMKFNTPLFEFMKFNTPLFASTMSRIDLTIHASGCNKFSRRPLRLCQA
jgi:hypothetical protein